MSKVKELSQLGQSIWFDYISRELIKTGELKKLLDLGIGGMTSNPTIFQKAISGSLDYDAQIKSLLSDDLKVDQLYEALAIQDIGEAADLFLPYYEATKGHDGYVSLEVDPTLAYQTDKTLSEAKRLFQVLNRKNIMIKIPGTEAGIPAVESAIASGINVNVTLLFSVENYRKVAEAYVQGAIKWVASGGNPSQIASVASFFISRIDAKVDAQLESKNETGLKGKTAIANAKKAYQIFEEIFGSPEWKELEAKGVRKQRLLWASTGTKSAEYPDTMYVDELIGPETVNTVPPATLDAFFDHGTVADKIKEGWDEADQILAKIKALGIDLEGINSQLQVDGVKAFEDSFSSLLESVKEKRDLLCTV